MNNFANQTAHKVSRIEDINITFGKNVKVARQRLGISQEELAYKAGLNRNYVGMLERAERSVSLQIAKKIADALNVKLDNLLTNE